MRRLWVPLLVVAVVLPAAADAARVRQFRSARLCDANARRLDKFETRQLAICGQAEGCTLRAQRRHARYVATSIDLCTTLNEVQVLGSHNSYHIRPLEPLWSLLIDLDPGFGAWEYTHLPLDQQFATQGVRQIELDVWVDPDGGLFRLRRWPTFIGDPPILGPAALDLPGTKVLHIQDVDFETNCLSFVDCLQTVKMWSDANPGHLPLMILVEAKDDSLGPSFAEPIPWGAAEFDVLDGEIRSVFPADRIIAPDDVRAGHATLEDAVLTQGWPTLGWSRGKVLFALDNGNPKRAAYLQDHPSLAGRILFTDSPPGQPEAAFAKENDPLADPQRIPDLVDAGYIVRTRADSDTDEARTNDTAMRDAAIASGAQYVSTDYPVPNPDFGTGYFVEIPGGSPARCNPINAPAWCRSSALESLP
jgi:hypothetical protein